MAHVDYGKRVPGDAPDPNRQYGPVVDATGRAVENPASLTIPVPKAPRIRKGKK